ncbi:type IV pilus twitching motility protein PilT [Stratiformator vulcanicus]|uniref:Twitching mobility protein n=1 Tax=Stratiformator vulcanicus TaxID=2527980 RepID=A0A517R4G9_9PLAN|nr:PilT/PilU family type 4a pilus ATPase [Stratiformator vulcanicus]QDT38779.1 Twitching mobility protein [Stratiformator vulcanicus]
MPHYREWTKSTFQIGKPIEIDKIFKAAVKLKCSDIHLQVGSPPIFRIKGGLKPLDMPPIDDDAMTKLTFPMMDQRNLDIFHRDGGADYAKVVEIDGENWRFRVNLFIQMGKVGMVARKVERSIPPFEKLGLPPVMEALCKFDQGMVLLAGVTGSGKSTTIGSMINWINQNMNKHILTIEDPIEFVYTSDNCLINQREIGMDVIDFHVAMKHAVREDPDIMLVGEMRDRETFETAIHAAETGHLVFGTIHASSAPGTIARILDLFPPMMHGAIRATMAMNMRAIVGQKLLKTIVDEPSRVPIVEIMRFNPSVKKFVAEQEDEKLYSVIYEREDGMQAFNHSLQHFLDQDIVSRAAAFEISPNPEQLKMWMKGITTKSS